MLELVATGPFGLRPAAVAEPVRDKVGPAAESSLQRVRGRPKAAESQVGRTGNAGGRRVVTDYPT